MRRAGAVVGVLAVVVSVAALGLLLAAGPGTRFGWWNFRTGLGLLRWVAYGAVAGAALGLVGLLLGGARAAAAIALVVGIAAFAVPWTFQSRARSVPPIHDITTDTEDPPRFVAVLARRAGAANSADYEGAKVASQQKSAYPDIAPIRLPDPPDRAFERALDAARSLGWEIVAAEPKDGRIEATDTTRWFGFKDDVVIRVRPDGAGSRADVRSVSRVGRSDVGANAARIRRFRSALGA
jgi:uncharacterized protein (DUF1499 family)